MILSRMSRIVWTALLTLAVASAWSSGSMAGSPQVTAYAYADVEAGHAHHPTLNGDAAQAHFPAPTARTYLASDPAGLACCVMTTCHPAIPVPPVQIAPGASKGQPAPVSFPRPDGNEPSPALQPPRNSQV